MSGPLTWFGDDFTGSSDVLLQYTRLGVPATLFLRTPAVDELHEAAATYDAVGVAGVTRALRTPAIAPVVREVFGLLATVEPRVVQYKICSTADSSVEIGSIAPAVEAGGELFGAEPVAILPAQPDLGRYTLFGHHFGRDAHGVHRLDRLPAMAHHPVTPMTESDLRIHFAQQLGSEVGGLDLPTVRAGAGAEVLERLRGEGTAAYVVDAVDNDDLRAAAQLLLADAEGRCLFAVGSGGLATGLALATPRGAVAPAEAVGVAATAAPARCLAVCGSASQRTTDQIDDAIAAGWAALPLDPARLASPSSAREALAETTAAAVRAFADHEGVLVYTAHHRLLPPSGTVSSEVVGTALADLARDVRRQVELPRLVVAGGDTSGYVLTSLRATRLSAAGQVGDDLVLGVVGSEDETTDGLEVVLKGGQLGSTDVFERALRTAT